MSSRAEKLVFISVLNFRRVTHFLLCLLEMQAGAQLGAKLADWISSKGPSTVKLGVKMHM